MEDREKRLPPPLPANYVSFIDLRDRWMKQQQQKKQAEQDERKTLQPNSEVRDDPERTAAEDKIARDDDHQPNENSVQPNPNPSNGIRRTFQDNRRQIERRNYRWIQVSQTKSPKLLPPKQAPAVPTIRPKRTPPVLRVVPKALPELHPDKSKPSPSEAPKIEVAVHVPGEIQGSEKEVKDPKFDGGKKKKRNGNRWNKRRSQDEDLVQSQPTKGVLEPAGDLDVKANPKLQVEPKAKPVLHANQSKPKPPLKAPVVERGDEIHGSDEIVDDRKLDKEKKKKPPRKNKNRNRNQKMEDVIEPQQKKGILAPNGDPNEKEIPKQEAEAEGEKEDVDDQWRAEIEGELANLSLDSKPGESCSRSSVAARNRHGWRKDGGYGKFERRVMLKKERAKNVEGFVWVRKVVIPVENAGKLRV